MTIKEFVLSNVEPDQYYKSRFPEWDHRARPTVICPFHDDTRPSFSLSLKNGGAKCHSAGCGKALGNIVHCEAELFDKPESDAAGILYREFCRQCLTSSEVRGYEKQLDLNRIKQIETDCGLTKETCRRHRLGWDIKSSRMVIPITDRFSNTTNLRYYKLPSHRTSGTKIKIFNKEGYGYLEFFPWNEIKKFKQDRPVIWMKAEKDTMLALQMGFQAFCLTNGEGSWNSDMRDIFSGFNLLICGDNDEAGEAAILKRIKNCEESGLTCRRIDLPTERKDFADWIVSGEGSSESFDSLVNDKSELRRNGSGSLPSGQSQFKLPKYFSESLDEVQHLVDLGRNAKMLNTLCRVRAIVSGKLDRTYSVPYKFRISSTSCPSKDYTVPLGRSLLRFVRSTDEQISHYLRNELLKNSKAKFEILEYVSISELEIIPAVNPEYESPYVTFKCFYVGEHIETNVPYDMEIVPTTEIRSQETVGIITSATAISRQVTNFDFNPEETALLESFQPEDNETPYEALYNLLNHYALQFSQIYNRVDWHMVALLSWASPLQFNFPNEGVQRGWLNSLALGDTQTGKSEVVKSIREITNSGVFVNAENCTYVGLVGGAVKTGSGQFMLRWGKIPLNNKQLVIVEELSGLSIEEISNLSEVRSSGLARLDKGGLSSETSARTRLICLSNVRGRNQTLAGYISGVRAIQDLIGHGEDISRFDFICTLTDREVSADVINQPRFNSHDDILDRDAFRSLIRFIWSLKPDQIHITREAYYLCLQETKRLSLIYHPSIPLFKAGSGRLKVARIACAIACLQFHWDGKQIIVDVQHIHAAVQLLQMLYDKESCGYREYSQQMYYKDKIESEDTLNQIISQHLSTHDKKKQTFKYLLHAGRFTQDELSQVAGIQIFPAGAIIGKMINSNIIRKGEANTWEVTHLGKTWIQKQMVNGVSISPSPSPILKGGERASSPSKSSLISLLKRK